MVLTSCSSFHRFHGDADAEFPVHRSFLHPGDPFSVPSHLREQVADFEDQYRTAYTKFLDNHPDSTKESLYE